MSDESTYSRLCLSFTTRHDAWTSQHCKDNCPLRPVLSATGTCGYKLSKDFVPVLPLSTNNQFTIKKIFFVCK